MYLLDKKAMHIKAPSLCFELNVLELNVLIRVRETVIWDITNVSFKIL